MRIFPNMGRHDGEDKRILKIYNLYLYIEVKLLYYKSS